MEEEKTMTGVLAKEYYNIRGWSWKAIHFVAEKTREKEIRGNETIYVSIKSASVQDFH